jgi:hypothetical protein
MKLKGFTIKEDHNEDDLAFEAESDSIENYQMISNEFDYEALKDLESFKIKQYKDSLYRG